MRLPKHIGIIPDGNRRWANSHGMKKEDGYDYGLLPGLKVLKQAQAYHIPEITYYGFTVDNCKRPPEQRKAFQKACVDAVELIRDEDVSLLVIGNTKSKCFPEQLLPYTSRTEKDHDRIKVNFLVNYGWEWDMDHILENGLPRSADISSIDLIIRWGGMRRLSGFLPLQSVYADFYVEDTLWPDYSDQDFEKALEWYQKQDVTKGG